jgi:hypothetical protein
LVNIALFVVFGHFLNKFYNLKQKNFGQKIVVLAHSEECDVAKTSLYSILKHFERIDKNVNKNSIKNNLFLT